MPDDLDAMKAALELCRDHGFATGHGDTLADIIREISGQIAVAPDGAGEALRKIIEIDQHERKTLISADPAGNDYAIEMVDGPCAKLARAALGSGGRE